MCKKIKTILEKNKITIEKNKAIITLIILIIFLFVLPIVLYHFFIIDGTLPLGSNLTRSDWLGFSSGLLGYIGTVFLGIVAFSQNRKSNEFNEKMLVNDLVAKSSICVIPNKVTISDRNPLDSRCIKLIEPNNCEIKESREFQINLSVFSNIPLRETVKIDINYIELGSTKENDLNTIENEYKISNYEKINFDGIVNTEDNSKDMKYCFNYDGVKRYNMRLDDNYVRFVLQGEYVFENISGIIIKEKFHWHFVKGEIGRDELNENYTKRFMNVIVPVRSKCKTKLIDIIPKNK